MTERKKKELNLGNCITIFDIIFDYLVVTKDSIGQMGPQVVLPTIICLILLLGLFAYTWYLFYKTWILTTDKNLNKQQLLIETTHYKILRSFDFTNGFKNTSGINIIFYLIVPPIALIMSIIAFVRYKKLINTSINADSPEQRARLVNVKWFLIFLLVQSIIMTIGCYAIFGLTYYKLKPINKVINDYNVLIRQNIVNDAGILSVIQSIPADGIEADNIVNTILNQFTPSSSANTIAQTFLTINLYKYYLRMGLTTNANLADALNNFSPIKVLMAPDFAAYLSESSTSIISNAEILRSSLNSNINADIVNQAVQDVSNKISTLNSIIAKLNLSKVISIVLFCLLTILIVQVLLVSLIVLIWKLWSEHKEAMKIENINEMVSKLPREVVKPSAPPEGETQNNIESLKKEMLELLTYREKAIASEIEQNIKINDNKENRLKLEKKQQINYLS